MVLPVLADSRAASIISATSQIVLEGRQSRRLHAIQNDGAQIGEFVIGRRGNFGGGFGLFLRLFRRAHLHAVVTRGQYVAGLSVDFHILTADAPVPGSLDNGLRFRIGEDDGGFVFHLGVDIGLDVLGDGGDGKGARALHDPSGKVSTIASEIVERAGSIQFGIGEPAEKFRANANFFRAGVAAVDDDLTHIANGSLADGVVHRVIAGDPGNEIVDENDDVGFARDFVDGPRIGGADGQRLFHHYSDVMLGADFDNLAMVESIGICQDGLRLGGGKHFIEIGVIERGIELELFRILIEQFAVRLADSHDVDVRTVRNILEESFGMPVDQSGNGHTERLIVRRKGGRPEQKHPCDQQYKTTQRQFHFGLPKIHRHHSTGMAGSFVMNRDYSWRVAITMRARNKVVANNAQPKTC